MLELSISICSKKAASEIGLLNTAWHLFLLHFFSLSASYSIWDFDHRIMSRVELSTILLVSPPPLARFEPLILGLWVKCSTTALLGNNTSWHLFLLHFSLSVLVAVVETSMIEISSILSSVLPRHKAKWHLFLHFLSLSEFYWQDWTLCLKVIALRVLPLARFELPILRLWVQCTTTVFLGNDSAWHLLLLHISLSQWKDEHLSQT